jgi:hypothetical protein
MDALANIASQRRVAQQTVFDAGNSEGGDFGQYGSAQAAELLSQPFDWVEEARKVAVAAGYDQKIIPDKSNADMYGAMRDQMQGHSDPLRMLRMTSLEPTKGNIGMAEMFYNNPNATRADLEGAFKQANKGGGMFRQVLGDDITNAMGSIGSIVGNAVLPGFGGAFGNAVGSMVGGTKFDPTNAALSFAGGQFGDYLNTTFSEIGKTGANAIAGAGQGAVRGVRGGVDGMLREAVGGAGASLIGNAGRLADNSITELTGVNALGDAARLGTRAVLTGKDLKASDLANLGIDYAKGTEAYGKISDYLSSLGPDIDLGSLNIEGITIPGLPSMSQNDKNALIRLAVGNKAANILTNPAGAAKTALTNALTPAKKPTTTASSDSSDPTATMARLLAISQMGQPQAKEKEEEKEEKPTGPDFFDRQFADNSSPSALELIMGKRA